MLSNSLEAIRKARLKYFGRAIMKEAVPDTSSIWGSSSIGNWRPHAGQERLGVLPVSNMFSEHVYTHYTKPTYTDCEAPSLITKSLTRTIRVHRGSGSCTRGTS